VKLTSVTPPVLKLGRRGPNDATIDLRMNPQVGSWFPTTVRFLASNFAPLPGEAHWQGV
jgi:hypothetical protein